MTECQYLDIDAKNVSGSLSLTRTVMIDTSDKMVRGTDFGEKMKCLFLVGLSSRLWVWMSRGRLLLETDLSVLIHGTNIKKHLLP